MATRRQKIKWYSEYLPKLMASFDWFDNTIFSETFAQNVKPSLRWSFKKKFLADTHVLFGATGTPVLDVWWRPPWGFKAQVGSALFAFSGGECNVHSLRSTSGSTHADLLAASAALVVRKSSNLKMCRLWIWAIIGGLPLTSMVSLQLSTIFVFSITSALSTMNTMPPVI